MKLADSLKAALGDKADEDRWMLTNRRAQLARKYGHGQRQPARSRCKRRTRRCRTGGCQ